MPSSMKIEEIIKQIKENPIESKGELYHPIPFPEFEGLTTSSNPKGVYEKWDIITNTLNSIFGTKKDLRVLDVGSNAGFYTFNFAKNGATVKSFECHDRYKSIGKDIAEAKKLAEEGNLPYVSPRPHMILTNQLHQYTID